MINIVTSGCSFTHDPDSWANKLKDKLPNNYNVSNVAEGGCGQEYIVRSAIIELEKFNGPKICMVQLSGFWRSQIHLDVLEHPELFEKVKFERQDYDERSSYGFSFDDFIVLKTTDLHHEWWAKGAYRSTRTIMKAYNEAVSHDQRLLWSYENISRLQMYCKINKIPLFCFYGWQGIETKPYNKKLVNLIRPQVDWNNIWFHKNGGGMAEWMLDHGHTGKLEEDRINKPPRGFSIETGYKWSPKSNSSAKEKSEWKTMVGHPTSEAHDDFCNQIIVPWVLKND